MISGEDDGLRIPAGSRMQMSVQRLLTRWSSFRSLFCSPPLPYVTECTFIRSIHAQVRDYLYTDYTGYTCGCVHRSPLCVNFRAIEVNENDNDVAVHRRCTFARICKLKGSTAHKYRYNSIEGTHPVSVTLYCSATRFTQPTRHTAQHEHSACSIRRPSIYMPFACIQAYTSM